MTPPSDLPLDALQGTPYRPLARLGAGAMGEVFLAEHLALKKRVVVKVLRELYASSEAMLDRMRLEAQAIAHLRHPNIVLGLDFGRTTDGRAYIVMESLEGRTFTDEVRERGPLPFIEACEVLQQVLAGLAEAHRVGIVHRDLKPGNLFLCAPSADGKRVAKILDFGIAKVLSTAGPSAPAPLALPTREGTAIGSPRYLSPEQARGQSVSTRSDLYSLGAVLYFLLTGRDPFRHRQGAQLLIAHASELPRAPSRVAPMASIPPLLDRAVLRALAKRAEDRFESAEAFASALRVAALAAPAAEAPPARWLTTEVIDVDALKRLRETELPRAPKHGTVRMDVRELRRPREAERPSEAVEEPTNVLPRAPEPASPWAGSQLDSSRNAGYVENWIWTLGLLALVVSAVCFLLWMAR